MVERENSKLPHLYRMVRNLITMTACEGIPVAEISTIWMTIDDIDSLMHLLSKTDYKCSYDEKHALIMIDMR
jgi:hypothetical protein